MQVHSLTRFIAAPFGFALVYIFYQSAVEYDFRDEYSWLIFPLLVICVALYMFSPHIDFWFHEKYPVALDKPVVDWLENQFSFYQQLNAEDRIRFQHRLSLFMEAKEYSFMKVEKMEMPEDMKFIIAAHAVWLNFGRDDYLLNKFERIIAYMHPFPTPFYKQLHTAEAEIQDGVVLLSFEYILRALREDGNYNIGLHGFADAFCEMNGDIEWPHLTKENEESLEQVSGLSYQRICSTVGFERVDFVLVAIHHYLRYPSNFKKHLPYIYSQLDTIFNLSTIHERAAT